MSSKLAALIVKTIRTDQDECTMREVFVHLIFTTNKLPPLLQSSFSSNPLAFLGGMPHGIVEIQEEDNRFWQSWMLLFQYKH